MKSELEQYEAIEGKVTLHTWTDVQGAKKGELLHYRDARHSDSLVVPEGLAPEAPGRHCLLSAHPIVFLCIELGAPCLQASLMKL